MRLIGLVLLASCSFGGGIARTSKQSGDGTAIIDTAIAAMLATVAIDAASVDRCHDNCNFDGTGLVAIPAVITAAIFGVSAIYGGIRAERERCRRARERAAKVAAARAQVACDRERASELARVEQIADVAERLRVLASLRTCTGATAEALPEVARGFAAAGASYSIDTAINRAVQLEGGFILPRMPIAIHGAIEAGTAKLATTNVGEHESSFVRIRGGLELRGCGRAHCAVFGIDGGYQRRAKYEYENPSRGATGTDRGPLVLPYVGADFGLGTRVTLRARLDIYRFHRFASTTEGFRIPDTDEDGAGVSISLGYRFGAPSAPAVPKAQHDSRVWPLIIDAAIAAELGDCEAVVRAEAKLLPLDDDLYRTVFARSRRIVACLVAGRSYGVTPR